MGNGASGAGGGSGGSRTSLSRTLSGSVGTASVEMAGATNEPPYIEELVPELQAELRDRDEHIERLEADLAELRQLLKDKEDEVDKLGREVHKLKSVLQATLSSGTNGHFDLLLSSLVGLPPPPTASTLPKKQGVSGESCARNNVFLDGSDVQRHDKDFRSKQLIKDAIMENDFLKNLDTSQVREMVDCMYSREFGEGSLVIKEGDVGCHLYVSAEGILEVIKEDTVLGRMGPGKAFGELAILYNCTRTATIKAVSNAKVWALDRRVFQAIMMRTGMQRQEESITFLRSVSLLSNLSNELLAKMADVLEVDFYPAREYIIREGAPGDTFFIISTGQVKVTKKAPESGDEMEIRTLERGDYFGEQALLKEEKRTASVIALEPGVECLVLDRESFNQLIGDLRELQDKVYDDRHKKPSSAVGSRELDENANIKLEDLDFYGTLGVGGFGRVELVVNVYDKNQAFALKCLKKHHVIEMQQQDHLISEKNIMMGCRHTFICRLHKTFSDPKYVYMLMDVCLGGEVWTILRDRGTFDDTTTRFYTACVVEALDYLHSRQIIYRDLKPENLLLDAHGYIKLVDFGFSKVLPKGQKTWTFCGTPEYVAPEIILNKGHDKAVDFWAVGVLMFELFTGTPPFTATDPMKVYNIILRGIEMLDFPRYINRTAQSLIKRLCRENPSERLGYQKGGIADIKKHKWFQGFDWDGLINRTLTPPIIPKVEGPTDVSNFDLYPRSLDSPPAADLLDWDKEWDRD